MITPSIQEGSVEDKTVRRFTRLWANFARTGNPNPLPDDLISVTWDPVEKGKINFLDIGEDLATGTNPESERMAFWDDIYKEMPQWLSKL